MEKVILVLVKEQIIMKLCLCLSHHVGSFSIHNTKRQFEDAYGTEAQLLHRTLKIEIEKLEQANDLFNFYAKER